MHVYMFRLLSDGKRILITKREEDLALLAQGWTLLGEYKKWDKAFAVAMKIAERKDAVLEWYLEDELESAKALEAVGRQGV